MRGTAVTMNNACYQSGCAGSPNLLSRIGRLFMDRRIEGVPGVLNPGEKRESLVCRPLLSLCAFAISLVFLVPLRAHGATDLHDLYNALQKRGQAVTIPAKVLGRLKLGLPDSDIPGKEIVITGADQDKRGITAFALRGVPYITMFHVEPNRDDAWLLKFSLDGRILNQEWEQGGYRTYEIQSSQVAEAEIGFWHYWMANGARLSP